MNALNVLCALLTRDLFAIANFLLLLRPLNWIAPKMFWMHYLAGFSHFAECRE